MLLSRYLSASSEMVHAQLAAILYQSYQSLSLKRACPPDPCFAAAHSGQQKGSWHNAESVGEDKGDIGVGKAFEGHSQLSERLRGAASFRSTTEEMAHPACSDGSGPSAADASKYIGVFCDLACKHKTRLVAHAYSFC